MAFLMIYLTSGRVFKAGTGAMTTADASALKALIEAGGTYTAELHNQDGTLH